MADAFGRFKVQYVYQELDRTFKRNILDAPRENSEPLTEEDLYWLDKDAIGLGEAREFLLTASTWIRRFEGDFTVVADVEAALSVKLLEAHPEAPQTDPVLLVDVRWYFLPDTIEELYSPLGLVICRGELLRGVFPKLLGEDLSLSGKKKFDRERTRKFLRDEWHLLRPFTTAESPALKPLFVPPEMCIVQEKPEVRVQIGGFDIEIDSVPEVFDRYELLSRDGSVFYGEQLYAAGVRPYRTHYTGVKLSELNSRAKKKPASGVFPIADPYSWYSSIPFKQGAGLSDVFLAGDSDFTFLAGQIQFQPTTHENALFVIKQLKEAIVLTGGEGSFEDYRKWQENFVATEDTAGNSFYCLIFMQELLNDLFDAEKKDKVRLFLSMWQTVSRNASRELKGRFIEAGIDWSLIEQEFGIYGYLSTLKNGYIHNAVLWQALLPENRNHLDPDLLFELASENVKSGIFAENPQYKDVVAKVFGLIDDYYRKQTGATFLASFHPDHFLVKAYAPYKDQIYYGYVGRLMLAELTPLVFHKPLVNFASLVFSRIKWYLKRGQEHDSKRLPQPIEEIVESAVEEFLAG